MNTLLPGLSATNLHPLVVHFPFAFWVLGTGFLCAGLWRPKTDLWKFGVWLQALGSLAALVAVALGYWATEQMGHSDAGHDLVHVHRDIMLGATAAGVLVAIVAWLKRTSHQWRIAIAGGALLQLGVMTLGSWC